MGYEMKFYIGIKHKYMKGIEHPDYTYFNKIAMFDYCKDSDLTNFTDKFESAKVYGFFTQEDKEEITDKYGEEFKAIPIEDLITYLEEHPNDYRRRKPFLALLKGFKEEKELFDEENLTELLVIRYGY